MQNPNFQIDFPIEGFDPENLKNFYDLAILLFLKSRGKIIKIFPKFVIFEKNGNLILFNNSENFDFAKETILPKNFDAENLKEFGCFYKNKNQIYFFDNELKQVPIDKKCAKNINYNFIAEKKPGGRVIFLDPKTGKLKLIKNADGETFQKDKITTIAIFDKTGNPALIEFSDQNNYYNYSGKILGTKEKIDGQLEIFEKLHKEPKLNNDEIIYLTTKDGKPSKNVRASLRLGSPYFSYLTRKLVAEIISENNSKK